MSDLEWVTAVPEKRNNLSHLVPVGTDPGWASRSAKALCGWAGIAKGVTWEDYSHRDKEGYRVSRRHCQQCTVKADKSGHTYPKYEPTSRGTEQVTGPNDG